jgi:hypothetical protein
MFRSMLATLEKQDLLRQDGDVRNLGLVMGLYVMLTEQWRAMSTIPEAALPDIPIPVAAIAQHIISWAGIHRFALIVPTADRAALVSPVRPQLCACIVSSRYVVSARALKVVTMGVKQVRCRISLNHASKCPAT